MRFPQAVIESLQANYGYTEREAQFVYIVATHSGHFLGRHFNQFIDITRGRPLQIFTDRATALGHIRDAVYSETGAKRYHVYSKPLYATLGKVNSSHRRNHEISKIVVKLLTLDFVLAHIDADYFDEEIDKVQYFHDELGVETPYLPLRVYKARNGSAPPTTRYFVDKFPIFIDIDGVLSFTYIDDPLVSTDAFRTHLFHYAPLFQHLDRPFRVWFASPVPGRFSEAERTFRRVVHAPGGLPVEPELLEYFDLRQRWEAKDLAKFTPELLRKRVELHKKYTGARYEKLYEDWQSSRDSSLTLLKKHTPTRPEFRPFEVQT